MSDDNQLAQACQRCWRRKQKCGRERPVCAQCLTASAECVPRIWGKVLEDRKNVSVEEQMSTRSAIEQMKTRIAFLEQQQQSSPLSVDNSASNVSQRPANTVPDLRVVEGRDNPEYGSLANAANEVEYLSVAAMAGPDRQDVQVDDGPSFAVLVSEATKLSVRSDQSGLEDGEALANLSKLQSELQNVCDRDLRFFVDIYCRRLGDLYPCVAHSSCYEALDVALQVSQAVGLHQEQYSMVEATILVCLTASLGIMNSSHYSTALRTLQRLKNYAFDLLSASVRDASDADAVRFLLLAALLCLHEFEKASTWHLIGLAFSKAISGGLHRFRSPPDDNQEDLMLFWTLYKLDRIFSFALGTPFSIEDGDMTVQLPQTTWSQEVDSSRISLRHYAAWAVHCVHLVSGWRKQDRADLAACYSSLSYWRETSSDLIKSAQSENNLESISNATIMSAKETQLTCRALVYLLLEASEEPIQPLLLDRVGNDLDREVPELLTKYRAMLDAQVLGPTLIDSFDIVGAVSAYVCSRQLAMRRQSQGGIPVRGAAIGVAGMRLVTSCMEVLRKMSERHAPILQLQEILWSFLSALEEQSPYSNHTTTAQHSNTQAIDDILSRSSLPVPRHIVRLLYRALG